jgi:hypothetical protein
VQAGRADAGIRFRVNITKKHPTVAIPEMETRYTIKIVRSPRANRSIDADSCFRMLVDRTVPNPLLAHPAFHVG